MHTPVHNFPENYVLTGISVNDWLPKTDVFVRTEKGTLRLDAELNTNEFQIDLSDKDFDWLQELWADNGRVEFKLGPANANVALSSVPADDSTAKLLETTEHIAARYSFLEMRTRCHAASMVTNDVLNGAYPAKENCLTLTFAAAQSFRR